MNEFSIILKALKQVSFFDLFLITFLPLPFIFEAWLKIFSELEFSLASKRWSLIALSGFYFIGVTLTLIGSSRAKKRDVAKDQIVGYLRSLTPPKTMAFFDKIKSKFDYSEKFIDSVIECYPRELRHTTQRTTGRKLVALTSPAEVEDSAIG
jgi:hypothetical protein